MNKAEVLFAEIGEMNKKTSLVEVVETLSKKAQLESIIDDGDIVAVKVHMGERGSIRYLRPAYVRKIVGLIKDLGGNPFVTDTPTLYKGGRTNAIDALATARENGFTPEVLGAPIIISGGIYGTRGVVVHQPGQRIVEVAQEIADSDAMISIAHVTGHIDMGMGASLKNIGMGCVTKSTKLAIHTHDAKPIFESDKCSGCGACLHHCLGNCIEMRNGVAMNNPEKCIGCGVCIAFCPTNAIKIPLLIAHPKVQKEIIESAVAVLSLIKREKVFFYNFIIDVNPNCDCFSFTENRIVPDIGIMASRDPLAVDKASFDIICKYPPLPTSNAKEICGITDKFKAATKVDISFQFEYAEKIGAGTTNYHLVRLPSSLRHSK